MSGYPNRNQMNMNGGYQQPGDWNNAYMNPQNNFYMNQQNQHAGYAMQQGPFGGQQRYPFNLNATAFIPRDAYAPPYAQYQQGPNVAQPAYSQESYSGQYQEGYPANEYAQNYNSPDMYFPNGSESVDYDDGFVPYGYGQDTQQYYPSSELMTKIQQCGNVTELQEIQVGFEQLLIDSDDIGSWGGAIKERLSAASMSDEGKTIALEILCEMATMVASFTGGVSPQYTFARLIEYLVLEIPNLLKNNLFGVLEQCHINRTKQSWDNRCNLLVFFAEVYARLQMESGNPINKIGDVVLDQTDDIIREYVNDQSMKNIIHVMKVAAADLDSTTIGYNKMSVLLTRLTGLATGHPQLSENIKSQLLDVIAKREKKWGRASRATIAASSSIPEGAIIDQDGKVIDLSEEERQFLENHLGSSDNDHTDHDTSIDDSDVLKEYGQFVEEQEMINHTDHTASILKNLSLTEDPEQNDVTISADAEASKPVENEEKDTPKP